MATAVEEEQSGFDLCIPVVEESQVERYSEGLGHQVVKAKVHLAEETKGFRGRLGRG